MYTEDGNTESTLTVDDLDTHQETAAMLEFAAWLQSLPEEPAKVGTLEIEPQPPATKDRPGDWSHHPTESARAAARADRDTNELFFRSAHDDEKGRRFAARQRSQHLDRLSVPLLLFALGAPFAIAGQHVTIPDDTQAGHAAHGERQYSDTDRKDRASSAHVAYSSDSFTITLSGCEENEKLHWSCKYTTPDGADHWMYIPNFKPKHTTTTKP